MSCRRAAREGILCALSSPPHCPDCPQVYIPLPTSIHVEWVRKAAARGLHVLLEKPIAASPTDLDAIVTACEQHGVQLMDGTMWTHNPRAKAMEQVIRDKARFGGVVSVHSVFTFHCERVCDL